MPIRKKPVKTVKKSTKRKITKKPALPRNMSMVSMGKGFPKKIKMLHKYHENVQLTSTTGSQANYQFSANGMYDPNITGVGHQPMYFDQCTALYDHFTVIASKIYYQITQLSTSNGPMSVACYLNDDSTVTPTFDSLMEQSSAKFASIPAGSNNTYRLSCSYSASKTFGKGVLANNALQGSSAANPTETAVFTLSTWNSNGATATISVEVFIEYIAVWTELRDIQGS